jgi:putative transcriptional regulator
MTGHIDDRLADLVVGDVDDDERRVLETHIAGCSRCARELAAAVDAFAAVALALPPEPPSPALRARILGDAQPPRLARMRDKLAALFDITAHKARALLDRLDDDSAWEPGPTPGSWVMLIDGGGPRVAGAFCGFVKMDASVNWPHHKHLGREFMLVLSGGFRQHDGVEVHEGQLHVMEQGSVHGFTIFEDEPCISAAVVFGGVEFLTPGVSFDLNKR